MLTSRHLLSTQLSRRSRTRIFHLWLSSSYRALACRLLLPVSISHFSIDGTCIKCPMDYNEMSQKAVPRSYTQYFSFLNSKGRARPGLRSWHVVQRQGKAGCAVQLSLCGLLVAVWRSPTSGALSPGRTRSRRRSGCQAVLGTRVGGPVAWRRPEGTSAAKTKSLGVGYLSRECVPALRSTPLLVSTVDALPAASALTGRLPASCVVRRFKETSRRLCPPSRGRGRSHQASPPLIDRASRRRLLLEQYNREWLPQVARSSVARAWRL